MRNSNKSLLSMLAYIAMIIFAVLLLISNVLPVIGLNIGGTLINVLNTVQNILILIVVGVSAYNFIQGKARWINVLYWIALVIFVVGTVFYWF